MPRASIRASAASSIPGSAWTTPCSKCSRGARTASPALISCSTTLTIVCRIAERIRLEPARRDAVEAERVEVLLAEHVVEDHARPRDEDPGAGAVRAGDARAHAACV